MFTAKIIRYNISESFNVVRWCLAIVALAFTCVVSVAKYIQLSDLTAITFSSLEITYLVLNDTVNLTYIYLPMYLFLVCGMMFDENFGVVEIIKCQSRGKWFIGKWFTLVFYTVLFFGVLLSINFMISNQVFPLSENWSGDFIKVQVMMGQSPYNFLYTPFQMIGLSLVSVLSLYLAVGTLSLLFSILTSKEVYALVFSLLIGILTSIVFIEQLDLTKQMSLEAFMWRNGMLLGSLVVIFVVTLWMVYQRDFNTERKE